MSMIFGLLKESGLAATESELENLAVATERYATGITALYRIGRLGMGVQPYFSHERSAMETAPAIGADNSVLSFDGRLDNYRELAELLGFVAQTTSDSQIVLAAFGRWGEACFRALVGDWALALWSEEDQALYLARDHAGTRSLYFQNEERRIVWSSYLDTFQRGEVKPGVSEDYAACYLACQPIGHLTTYEGILSVPPAHYLVIRNKIVARHSHWNPLVRGVTRYSSDGEYEAHFLALFEQSLERRTGPGAPILAQLSGGMDSTAIVCLSDRLRRSTEPHRKILDTISFFDDSEASLNETPYFSLVEDRRGKVGIHLDTAFSQRTLEPHDASKGLYLSPGADSFSIQQETQLWKVVWQGGYRSILSGIGGDEVLGGVSNPFPELADYLVSGSWHRWLRQSVAWSLIDRSPLFGTLIGTVGYAVRLYANVTCHERDVPPWISTSLRDRLKCRTRRSIVRSYLSIEPHRVENGRAWWAIMETLPHLFPQLLSRVEYRYPFLDRDLVEFLFSIPPEQLLRPGRRRCLMRRALVDIVPHEILERRRKAFQLRAPLSALQQAYPKLLKLFADAAIASAGFVNPAQLRRSLKGIAEGDPKWRQAMLKTIALELWMKPYLQGIERQSLNIEAGGSLRI
jgi:asparagine synthase (glutamine-hydrolysing)